MKAWQVFCTGLACLLFGASVALANSNEPSAADIKRRQDEINRMASEVVQRGWIGEVRLVTCDIHRHGLTAHATLHA